uniref:Uncharacterized protein n=1 Tax=Myoviridae sp. ctO4916 TaxID=2826645 RepID=A0A8S5N4B6_9CAUD|nr:MAG TPA: hypothetical protein [Myoviridae sp. ctO4916]
MRNYDNDDHHPTPSNALRLIGTSNRLVIQSQQGGHCHQWPPCSVYRLLP